MTGLLQTDAPSLVHSMLRSAERGAGGGHVVFAMDPDTHVTLGHDALTVAALATAARLSDAGVRRGDRVLLCASTSPDFLGAFLGCLFLGASPTATAMPGGFGALDAWSARLGGLLALLEPAVIVAHPMLVDALAGRPGLPPVLDAAELYAAASAPGAATIDPVLPSPEDTAFIQSTSGSTGIAKGVVVTHGNLATNCRQIFDACSAGLEDVWINWLPLHHDMGLIGGTLASLHRGSSGVLMPPERFQRRPAEWLQNVSRYRATLGAAPNFAYGYAAARIRDAELDGVDLGSWRFQFCGAEPIHPETVQPFVDRFGQWGFPEDALVPCYGLAEASLAVTVSRPRGPVPYDAISRQSLTADGVVRDVADTAGDPDVLRVVDCGRPVEGTEVRVVGEDGAVLPDGELGRIQFRGPSRTPGYFRDPEATVRCLTADGWWDTGDLGYLRGDALRIAGRTREIIVIRGANHMPSDFEHAAETVDGIRFGATAAVGIDDSASGTEVLHVVAETEMATEDHPALQRAVVAAVTRRTGIAPSGVHLVPRRTIPKTTSGKIKRVAVRAAVLRSLVAGTPVTLDEEA